MSRIEPIPTSKIQYLFKNLFNVETTAQNERYMSGSFDIEEKKISIGIFELFVEYIKTLHTNKRRKKC
jgi:hypothetical protein